MKEIFIHPVIRFWGYILLATVFILNSSWKLWLILFIISIALSIIEGIKISKIFSSLKSFLFYSPIFAVSYLLISVIMSQSSLWEIGVEILTAIIRLVMVMMIMNIYILGSKKHSLLIALRSMWTQLNKPWPMVENWFIYLEMTIRFYPNFMREWSQWQSVNTALGLNPQKKSMVRWLETARFLPGMLMSQLNRADEVAQAMQLRGYGRCFPRGVFNPIMFKNVHLLVLILMTIVFIQII